MSSYGNRRACSVRPRRRTAQPKLRSAEALASHSREGHASRSRQCKQRLDRLPWIRQALAHLLTAADTKHTPCAEVFAVIGQQSISVFANAGPGPLHRIRSGVEGVRFKSNFYLFFCREIVQRNIFDRTPFPGMMKAPIVNDLSIACVNSVVCIAFPLTNEVGAKRNTAFCADQRPRIRQPIKISSVHGEPPMSDPRRAQSNKPGLVHKLIEAPNTHPMREAKRGPPGRDFPVKSSNLDLARRISDFSKYR